MIIELACVSVGNKKGQELARALGSLLGPIQVQPGCLSCRVTRDWPAGDWLQIEARWESEENLRRHLQSDVYKSLLLLMELSNAPPVLEFFTVSEFRGLDLVESARMPSN